MSKKQISFCTVTFNNEDKITKFIENIESLKSELFETTLYVVDNSSTDQTVNLVNECSKRFNSIHLIVPNVNKGFGTGNNYVLPYLKSDFHVVINTDVIIPNAEVINEMILYMDRHPEIGLLSPKILNVDGTIQKLYKHNPSVLDMAIRFISPNLLKKRQAWFVHDESNYSEIGQIEHASGAFMFFRTKVFKEIGGFDERYFMYMEDADITREVNRISKAVFYPKVSVIHEWQRDSHKKIRYMLYTIKSMGQYFHKWGWKWM